MKTKSHLLLCVAFMAAATAIYAGEMHKWVDENGVTVYSQTAPADTASTTVAPPPPPPTGAESAGIELQQRIERLNKAEQARETAAAEKASDAERQAKKQTACARARAQLTALESGPPQKLLVGPDGTSRRLSYEELQEEIAKTRKYVNENCN